MQSLESKYKQHVGELQAQIAKERQNRKDYTQQLCSQSQKIRQLSGDNSHNKMFIANLKQQLEKKENELKRSKDLFLRSIR